VIISGLLASQTTAALYVTAAPKVNAVPARGPPSSSETVPTIVAPPSVMAVLAQILPVTIEPATKYVMALMSPCNLALAPTVI
jgi:hypothetical protein